MIGSDDSLETFKAIGGIPPAGGIVEAALVVPLLKDVGGNGAVGVEMQPGRNRPGYTCKRDGRQPFRLLPEAQRQGIHRLRRSDRRQTDPTWATPIRPTRRVQSAFIQQKWPMCSGFHG